MKKVLTYLSFVFFTIITGSLLLSCDKWEFPTKKSKRECDPPTGTLTAKIEQRKVDFSITGSSGTIDQVEWDFGNGSTTATTGMTVTYTYPTSGTYTAKATLTNTCTIERTLQQPVVVSDAVDPVVTLQTITTVSTNSAAAGMSITSDGNATITLYGICYSSTNQVPDKDKDAIAPGSLPVGTKISIPISLTGLQPNTLYYARSFAVNGATKTGYSAVQQFRTNLNPVVVTNGTASISYNVASVNFIVQNPGNPAAIQYGIYHSSETSTPDVNSPTSLVVSPAIGANVIVNLNDLKPNTVYYYRPYARLPSPSNDIIYGTIASFTTPPDPVAQDLIANVTLNERSLQDISGFNNHVQLVNNPTFTADRKGRANSAIQLNGTSQYFFMPDNSSLNPEALSVSLWIKPATLSGGVNGRMQIYNKARFSDGLPQTYSSLIKLENDIGPQLTFITDIKQNSNCQGGVGWQDLVFTKPVEPDTWYHLVFTYSGRSARMYFNKTLVFSTDNLPANKMDSCPGGELKFGAQYQSLPWYFKGAMDDIRIYKRALTSNEVQTLFNQ